MESQNNAALIPLRMCNMCGKKMIQCFTNGDESVMCDEGERTRPRGNLKMVKFSNEILLFGDILRFNNECELLHT